MGTNSTKVADKKSRTTTLMGLLCGLFLLLALMASPAYADEGSATGKTNAQGMAASETVLAPGVSDFASKSAQAADVKTKTLEDVARADSPGVDAPSKGESAAGAQEGDSAAGTQESKTTDGTQQGGSVNDAQQNESVGNAQQGNNADGAQKTDSADGAQQGGNAVNAQKTESAAIDAQKNGNSTSALQSGNATGAQQGNGTADVQQKDTAVDAATTNVQQKDTAVDAASDNETEMDGSASIVGQAGTASVPVHWIAYFNDAYSNLQTVNAQRAGQRTDPDPDSDFYGQPLGSLTWDSELESFAIHRAVELAVRYAHTRPNGERSVESIPMDFYNGVATAAENIAYGQDNVAEASHAWFEEERDGNGEKGHYYNISKAKIRSMACGCIESAGIKYYVQLFSSKAGDGKRTMYGDGVGGDSYVEVANASDIRLALSKTDTLTIKVGDTYQLNPDDESGYHVVGKNMRTGKNYDVAAWYLDWGISSGSSYASVETANNNPYYVRIKGNAVGTATVKATNTSNASNYMTFNVKVIPRTVPIANATITFADRTYTGYAHAPFPTTITYDGSTISPSNYALGYSNNVNAGTATVTITAIGDYYTGSTTRTFKINPANISNVTFTFPTQTYTGSALTPTPTSATFNGRAVASSQYALGSYSNNVNAGTARVAVTGKGNFTGTTSKIFTINPASISNATFTFYSATYTGSPVTPGLVRVTYNGTTLGSGDYSINGYYNNLNASLNSAYAYVTGKGNFTGSAYKYFTIAQASISSATVSIPTQIYTGSALTPVPVVTYNNMTLTSSDYMVGSYENNVNVRADAWSKMPSFTLTGKGNYTGIKIVNFTINPANIASVTFAFPAQTYTGSALAPAPSSATFNGRSVDASQYTLDSYANNVNPSKNNKASVVISGKCSSNLFGGNFYGTTTAYFTINPANIANATFTMPSRTYTGSAQTGVTPTKATWNGRSLALGTDYQMGAYSNNTNAGTASVVIQGIGKFAGTTTGRFAIGPANISAVAFAFPAQTYTGAAHTPAPSSVTFNGRAVAASQYALGTYSSNGDAGTASVAVTGRGNFTGTASKTFAINPANIAAVGFVMPAQTYTGSALAPAPSSATFNGKAVAASNYTVGSYKNNVNAGTAGATVTGKGNFTGTKSVTFTIGKADLAKTTVSAAAQTYTGTTLTPSPTVTFNGKTVAASNYTVGSYANNVNVGTGTVGITATSTGNFTGKRTVGFTINPANISAVTFAFPAQTYTGAALAPAPSSATFNGRAVAASQYTVGSYKNNVNAGTASVAVTGKGNFTGTASKTFAIGPASIASVAFAFPAQTYTGAALAPAPSSATFNGRAVAASQYALGSYSSNVNAGTASVAVTGKGNFTGVNMLNFAIAKAKIVESMIAAIPNQTYDGTAKTPLPTVTFNGNTLVYDKDYTVAYENNTNPGTAKAIVAGKGNFENSAAKAFTIAASPKPQPQPQPQTEIVWKRLWGQDAIGTMRSIASEAFANNSCSVAVIATMDGYWDALSASGLAGLNQCPVLLTDRNTLSKGTADELNRLGVKSVYIVGGNAAVGTKVEEQLKNSMKLSTTRLWGQNAVGTANSIANEILKTKKTVDSCIIATSDGYYDALSIAPYAYNKAIPVFLTAFEINGVKNFLRDDTLSIITKAGCTNAVIVGGASAVSGGTETLLVSKTKIESTKNVTRLGGKNAWETSNLIAEWSLTQGMTADNVGIADGNGYWDALTGAALCGKRGSVLLLVPHNGPIFDYSMNFSFDPFCIDNFLAKYKKAITRGFFFGGTAVVPTSTENYIKNATKR